MSPDARADGAGRRVAAEGRAGLLPIPCGSGQHGSAVAVPISAPTAVATRLISSQSERTEVLEAAEPASGPLDSSPSRSASLSDGTLLRYSSEVGAGCVSSARPDLCGRCRVTGIPTAISNPVDKHYVVRFRRLSPACGRGTLGTSSALRGLLAGAVLLAPLSHEALDGRR